MIGRRPHAAFGNSTGDRQMLEYTQAGNGTSDAASSRYNKFTTTLITGGANANK